MMNLDENTEETVYIDNPEMGIIDPKVFKRNVIIRRIFELIGTTIAISFIVALLCQLLFNTRAEMIILQLLAYSVMIYNTFTFSRWLYFNILEDKSYYLVTGIIHTAFFVINTLCCMLIPNIVYSWGFVLAKFLKYIIPGTSNLLSIIAFHGVLIISSLVSVASIRWIAAEKETEPEIEMLQVDENHEEVLAQLKQESTEA